MERQGGNDLGPAACRRERPGRKSPEEMAGFTIAALGFCVFKFESCVGGKEIIDGVKGFEPDLSCNFERFATCPLHVW